MNPRIKNQKKSIEDYIYVLNYMIDNRRASGFHCMLGSYLFNRQMEVTSSGLRHCCRLDAGVTMTLISIDGWTKTRADVLCARYLE